MTDRSFVDSGIDSFLIVSSPLWKTIHSVWSFSRSRLKCHFSVSLCEVSERKKRADSGSEARHESSLFSEALQK
jgi:hypothetical protein